MDLLLRLARNLGIAASIGLFASAASTTASIALYDVEPARPRAAMNAGNDDEEPRAASKSTNDDWERRKRRREAAVATILGHNPFCDGCEPPAATSADPHAPKVVPAGTPLNVQLVATMESSEASASLATIYDRDRGTWLARVGDEIESGAVLTAIGPGRVSYERGGVAGVLDMLAEPAPKPRGAAKPTQKPSPAGAKRNPAKSDKINCENGGSCTVERSLIDEVLANPTSLGGVRAFPSSGGFKIAGVRRGSLVHQLGLRSGDVLTEVNGRPLDSIDAALNLLPKLKNASNLSVTLSRRGKPQTHNVSII